MNKRVALVAAVVFHAAVMVRFTASPRRPTFPASSSTIFLPPRASTSARRASPSCRTATTWPRTTISGPRRTEHQEALTAVFRSADRGKSWARVSEIHGAFWSSLFVHRGALYLLGPDRHHGNILIRRSTDGGEHWTTPTDSAHRPAPRQRRVPLRPDAGDRARRTALARVRVAQSARGLGHQLPRRHAVGAGGRGPAQRGKLDVQQLPAQRPHVERRRHGRLAGRQRRGRAGRPAGGRPARADAIAGRERPPSSASAPTARRRRSTRRTGFVDFPGGAKKFAIRFDPQSKQYWSLASIVHERHRAENPGSIRNTLALTCSRRSGPLDGALHPALSPGHAHARFSIRGLAVRRATTSSPFVARPTTTAKAARTTSTTRTI